MSQRTANILPSIIMVSVYVMLAFLGAVHYVQTAQEDTATVWVCSIMGNRECGPDANPIDIRF